MWQDTVAVVTGASSGIGAAVSLALANKGARLALLARSPERLAAVGQEARAHGAQEVLLHACDIREEEPVTQALTATVETFGRLDILINSAGLSLNGAVDGYATADWRTVIDTNLTGTFLTCRAVLPTMKKQQRGQIINIASGAGRTGIKEMAAYCASKFGVVGFTEALALEVREDNIRVAALLPGSVATGFSQTARRQAETDESASRDIGYALLPDEVAAVMIAMLEQPPQAWMSEVVLRPLNLNVHRRLN